MKIHEKTKLLSKNLTPKNLKTPQEQRSEPKAQPKLSKKKKTH